MDLYKELCAVSGQENVLTDEPMRRHTTFRIGGPADYFVTASCAEEIRDIIGICLRNAVPYYIMGNGSDLLVGDKGFRGVIIQIFKRIIKSAWKARGSLCRQGLSFPAPRQQPARHRLQAWNSPPAYREPWAEPSG